jgi:hypothetical protein
MWLAKSAGNPLLLSREIVATTAAYIDAWEVGHGKTAMKKIVFILKLTLIAGATLCALC